MSNETIRDASKAFIGRLRAIVTSKEPDRALLANLRRGLTGDFAGTLMRCGYVFKDLNEGGEKALENGVLVAGLLAKAWQACPWVERVGLGQALGRMHALQKEAGGSERALLMLLDTDSVDLPAKLRQVITRLMAKNQGLDWGRLFDDLQMWGHPDRIVQKKWAIQFWDQAGREGLDD